MVAVRYVRGLCLILIAGSSTSFAGTITAADEKSTAVDLINADILLEGGTLYCGDGQPPVTGDVAVMGDRIVAVGSFPHGRIGQSVDCTGLAISPGFIDLHNHSDKSVLRKETRSVVNFLTQGCTTIVTGNCGSGPVNVGEYYRKLDEFGSGVNVAHLLPQGALRQEVMRTEKREATAAELAEMQHLTSLAMIDGAWGMSTGLIYVPSSYADTSELAQIAEVVGNHGGIYASHIRGEGSGLLNSVREAIEIGRRANAPVHISHFKSSGQSSWGLVRVAIDMIRKQREDGQVVTADQYPYIASSTSLSATFIPPWARAGGRKKMLARMQSREDSERIESAIRRKLKSTDQGQRIQIASYSARPQWAGRRLKQIADEQGITPFELVVQIEENGGASIVNYSIDEEDVRYVMQQSWVATASDGSARSPGADRPHPRSYGTFPRRIGHYSIKESVITIEQAVRSASGLPADILGMKDRGYLRTGYFADIAVWDADQLIDKATFEDPHQLCEGIRYLLVNGRPAIWNDRLTGTLAGRPLRHTSRVSGPAQSQHREDLNSPPPVTATAWAIADGASGKILWNKNATEKRKSASITKVMCALVVLSLAEKDAGVLDEVITFSRAADETGGSTSSVKEGERVVLREGLYGLMLPSGNDMGNAIAEHFHPRLKPPTEAMLQLGLDNPVHDNRVNFLAEMNRYAQRLEMNDTFYRIAYGDGGSAEDRTTTAADLCRLAHHAWSRPMFRKITGTERFVGNIRQPNGETRQQVWQNTNQLLGLNMGYNGIKTGTTQNAGRCLLSSGVRDGRHLFVVVLGAESAAARWSDSRNLYRWAWTQLQP